MRVHRQCVLSIVVAWFAAGCASIPTGPSVMVLPAVGKSFEQFQADDAVCRAWAHQQTGGKTPASVAAAGSATGAVTGAAVGAAAGAAIGAASGHPGAGAAVGAGAGGLGGTVIGAGAGDTASRGIQRRYDNAYIQCMYAKGNQVPLRGQMVSPPAPPLPPPPPPPPPSSR